MDFLSRHKLPIAGIVLGASAGFAYWYFIGCTSGTCPITSQWLNSTLYGALLGFLLANGKQSDKPKTEPPANNA
jgi:hypothetical protein